MDALNASVVNQKLADDQAAEQRAAGLQQANLGLINARTGQVNAATTATKQSAADDAALQPTKVAEANARLGYTKAATAGVNFKLSADALNAVRSAQSSFVQAMGTQLQDGNVDTKALENAYNNNLPDALASKGIKPGSLQIDKNTGAFSFLTKTGHMVKGTYAGLKAGLVAPTTTKDPTLSPSQTVTASTQWTNTAKGLISGAFGAGFNSNGSYNPGEEPELASRLTGVAASIGQRIGYQNVPAGVVANAVLQANQEFGGSKNGITGDGTGNPNFMARVQQLIQAGSAARQQQTAGPGGIPTQSPQQPSLGANPQPRQPTQPPQPAQRTAAAPYPDGTRLQGPDGKVYIVQNGQPVLAPNQ